MQNTKGAGALSLPSIEDDQNVDTTPQHNIATDQQTPGTQQTVTDTPGVSTKPVARKIHFSPVEIEINKISEEIRKLDEILEQLDGDESASATEKDILGRDSRNRRRNLSKRLGELSFEEHYKEYQNSYKDHKEAKEEEKRKRIHRDFKGTDWDDELKLKKETEGKPGEKTESYLSYCRHLHLCEGYKKCIMDAYDKIKEILKESTVAKTTLALEKREIDINTQVNVMKHFSAEFKKPFKVLTEIADASQIPHFITWLTDVMEMTSEMEAKLKIDEEKMKKRLALMKIEQPEGLKLKKFSGMGLSKFLEYYVWYKEFDETIIKKEYSDSVKLKFLKQYTEKDAHDIIKNYHHGKELMTAFKKLDDQYGKPAMVIKETFKNLRCMEVAKSHFDIKANRKLLNAINTNISTLKCYNVDLSGPDGQDENSTFLIEMEEKIPHNTYIKWEEHKEKLKESGENITIDVFWDFYNKQINMEENARHLRRPNRTD